MDLVVVIPTCEHLGYAYRALVSLGKCTPDVRWKAILVDDASRQWDGERWSKWPLDNVIRHHFPTRKGLTRSWNFGIEKAEALKARYTVVTNSETSIQVPPSQNAVGNITIANNNSCRNAVSYHAACKPAAE